MRTSRDHAQNALLREPPRDLRRPSRLPICTGRWPRPAAATIRSVGGLLRSSASCHMPPHWIRRQRAAPLTKGTSAATVQWRVDAIKEAAYYSSPQQRRATPAQAIAHPSSMAAVRSLVVVATNAATMDRRTDCPRGQPTRRCDVPLFGCSRANATSD